MHSSPSLTAAPGARASVHAIPSASTFSALINLAGRQRMLSQRIVLQTVLASIGIGTALESARQALALFSDTHVALVEGGGEQRLPGLFSEALRQAYFGPRQADARIREFMAAAKDALHAVEHGAQQATTTISVLADKETPLLALLNEITATYEEQASSHAKVLQKRSLDLLGDIQSIAKQARIVAFNARVAAARAGEPGREFVAVASVLSSVTDDIDRLAQTALHANKQGTG